VKYTSVEERESANLRRSAESSMCPHNRNHCKKKIYCGKEMSERKVQFV
jgi:hypothetical protein